MPELPEVEVVKRSLERKIRNKIIKNVKIIDGNLRYKVNKKKAFKLIGKKIIKITRRSKFLIFRTNSKLFMLVHLGMTGKFFFQNRSHKKFKTSFYYQIDKNDHNYDKIIFYFQNKKKLIYNDVRKFGFVKFFIKKNYSNISHIKKLGPEPLEKQFNYTYFKKNISGRNKNIKNILMDQKFVSGLGNIYVNEVLFASGVKPTRAVVKLNDFEIRDIIKNIKKILKKAITFGGSTIKDFSSENGKKGVFQQHFKVYDRKGEKCSNIDCNDTVLRTFISNRSSFFCKNCQK